VVVEPDVTVTTSSLEVSGSRISVYGKVVGKPLIETTTTPVVASFADADGIDARSFVSIAVAE